jgi:thiamine-phosphate pyrophosphorylase
MLRYAITDRMRLGTSEPLRRAALLDQARQCAAGGVDFLQLREKDLSPRDLVEIARAILVILKAQPEDKRIRLLINSRADVAVAATADGVHLTSAEGAITPAQVRALYISARLPEPITSISCHTLADVTRARPLAPSLILFGPVFEKVVTNSATQHTTEALISCGTGLDLLRTACATAAPTPVLALGGVTKANAPECVEAGAAGIAAIRQFQRKRVSLTERDSQNP